MLVFMEKKSYLCTRNMKPNGTKKENEIIKKIM